MTPEMSALSINPSRLRAWSGSVPSLSMARIIRVTLTRSKQAVSETSHRGGRIDVMTTHGDQFVFNSTGRFILPGALVTATEADYSNTKSGIIHKSDFRNRAKFS